ncbi:MAG: Na-translocating system protein MpsB, partial [Thioalkalispiraceae bacterium]
MSQAKNHTVEKSRRQLLIDAIDHMEHILPGQAPLKDFVHHNTLHGFQNLKFEDAIAAAHATNGKTGFESFDAFREYFKTGRITLQDINQVLDAERNIEPDELLYSDEQITITARDIYLIALCTPLPVYTDHQLSWEIEEHKALEFFDPTVAEDKRKQLLQDAKINNEKKALDDLWQACTGVLNIENVLHHPEELIELTSEQAEQMIQHMVEQYEATHDTTILNKYTEFQAEELLQDLLTQVGSNITIRQLVKKLTGKDSLANMRQYIVRLCSSYLDLGYSAWQIPGTEQGLIAIWKTLVKHDAQFNLIGLDSIAHEIDDLADDAYEVIELELKHLGIPQEKWEQYLSLVALEIPGWSGMIHWRYRESKQGEKRAIHFEDYLAIRLVLERLYTQNITRSLWRIDISLDVLRWYFRSNKAEYIVRYLTYNTALPEYLHHQVERLIDHSDMEKLTNDDWQDMANLLWTWRMRPAIGKKGKYDLYKHAWPLFLIMQHLGICASKLREWTPHALARLFEYVSLMQSEYGQFIWLQAYENHYRDQVLTAIFQNDQRGNWYCHENEPLAQIVFCMDDREEGFRRHLETINPDIETFGAAGFFAVAMDWKGLDDEQLTPLCPIVVTPAHA